MIGMLIPAAVGSARRSSPLCPGSLTSRSGQQAACGNRLFRECARRAEDPRLDADGPLQPLQPRTQALFVIEMNTTGSG